MGARKLNLRQLKFKQFIINSSSSEISYFDDLKYNKIISKKKLKSLYGNYLNIFHDFEVCYIKKKKKMGI